MILLDIESEFAFMFEFSWGDEIVVLSGKSSWKSVRDFITDYWNDETIQNIINCGYTPKNIQSYLKLIPKRFI